MSVSSILSLLCILGIVLADPLSPYMGINWVTDDVSLSLCRNGCQNLCCPLNATLSVQGINNNMYLYINIDPQSASKCGVSSYTAYSTIDTSSSVSYGAKFSASFLGISYTGFIDGSNNNELTYTFPIPGGSGNCVMDAPNPVSIIGVPPTGSTTGASSTSNADFVSMLYGLTIVCIIFLFMQ